MVVDNVDKFCMMEPKGEGRQQQRVVCFCSERCFAHYRRAAFKKSRSAVLSTSGPTFYGFLMSAFKSISKL